MSDELAPRSGDYIPHDMSQMYVDQLEQDWNRFAPDISEAGQKYVQQEFRAATSFLGLCEYLGVRSVQVQPHDDGHMRLYEYEPFRVRAEDLSWYEIRLAQLYHVPESSVGIKGMTPVVQVRDWPSGYLVGVQRKSGLQIIEGVVGMMRGVPAESPEQANEFIELLRGETSEAARRLEQAYRMQANYIDVLGNLATSPDFVNSVAQSWTDFTKFNRQNLQ